MVRGPAAVSPKWEDVGLGVITDLEAPRPRLERLMQYFDVAGWSGGFGQSAVPSEQEYLQCLSERYVGGVVDGQVVAQFPAAGQQGPVWCSPERKRAQVSQCQCRSPCVHDTSPDLPPPDRHNLQVHQLGRG